MEKPELTTSIQHIARFLKSGTPDTAGRKTTRVRQLLSALRFTQTQKGNRKVLSFSIKRNKLKVLMGVKYVPRHKTLRIFMNFDRNNAIMEKITDNDYQSFSQSCFYLR